MTAPPPRRLGSNPHRQRGMRMRKPKSLTGPCHACGRTFAMEDLDAKPSPGPWTLEQLEYAADTGRDFLRLECADCYGPNYVRLA